MYCTKCGKLALEEDQFCNDCGQKIITPEVEKKESIILAVLALVFSVLCPLIGFHIGLVSLEVYRSVKYRNLAAIGVAVSILMFAMLCAATLLIFYFI